MKKTIFSVTALLAALGACTPAQQHSTDYTVTGEVKDSSANGKTIYMMRYNDQKNIDSTVVKDNRFTFAGKVDTASACGIRVNYKEFCNFILEPGNIHVDMEKYNEPSGTPQNDEWARLSRGNDSCFQAMYAAEKNFKEQYTDPKEFAGKWKEWIDARNKGLDKIVTDLYKMHNDDAVGYYLLNTIYFGAMPAEKQAALISTFGPWLSSQNLVKQLSTLIDAQLRTAEGKPFADVKGKDAEGNPVALSDYIGKGNYVLLDMWASWCAPCKQEVPYLEKLHKRYKDKGLTVLGMFVWDSEENFKKATENGKPGWPQIFDSEKKAMDTYGESGTGIPCIIFFAPDGTVLKRRIRGENMVQFVNDIMDKK